MRREFVIDGSKFNDLEGFYHEIQSVITKDLPWEISNLDGFNDILRGGFGVHEYGEPIKFKWVNFKISKKCLGYEATIKHYERVLKFCHPTNIDRIKLLLENAKRHSGQTLLDIIVEIVLDTDNSGHDCQLVIED
ncbi:MAG: ribonuclease inhibitor [Sedimentibacter sp.]|uniref:ribonuclease inhibitor n=1 Tax=Sedimentibacter sp. TaxID=1960295 RepID=UPI0031582043